MNEQIRRILDHSATKPIAFVAAGFIAGVNVGYLLGRRNRGVSSPPPEELAKISEEVALIKARREAREAEKPVTVEIVVPGEKVSGNFEEPITVTVIEDTDWDYEEEKKTRDSLSPYVIHKDEFWSNEMDFAQHTWTYYEGDDVMVDEEDIVVYNHDQKIGQMKFGHGSGDKDTVYIRNEKMKMEMEVLREEGLYSIEVMGMEMDRGEDKDVEHSTMKQKRSRKDERLT